MTDDAARFWIAIVVIGSFMTIIMVVLFGFTPIDNPEVAKLVGVVIGYVTGLITPIVAKYFKNGG